MSLGIIALNTMKHKKLNAIIYHSDIMRWGINSAFVSAKLKRQLCYAYKLQNYDDDECFYITVFQSSFYYHSARVECTC